ncbi:Hypothetical_protein [Hexamita inflata]|uniref:Hypothetical_protein n=1 Tax=Hexamita inflata TaxID=28002 RepID=A0AA86P2G9_9EUKA|nr:Hypothetical protein HINF_LOCUS17215 [Hexamita inflata]
MKFKPPKACLQSFLNDGRNPSIVLSQSQPKDDQNSKYTMIDDQNDYKFNRQSTIDNHADIEWKYCFYQKQWSDEVGVVIQFLVVYKSIVYMQLQNCKLLIVFQSLTQSKQTIEIARTRSDRRRWLALFCLVLIFLFQLLQEMGFSQILKIDLCFPAIHKKLQQFNNIATDEILGFHLYNLI